ncbi:MAG: ATP-dependent Clp protease adapter ClpS [Rhodocyclaceae bacterium]|nr:ATP-dependent Clp protease adapter ClpS [Rhodocyclaceae bacterium]
MTTHEQHSVVLEEELQQARQEPPPFYRVLLLNDDFTPMDFVVHLLQTFFCMTEERAMQVMLKVHTEGSAVCGVFPYDIAATKVEQVIAWARRHQHPLACVMEEDRE